MTLASLLVAIGANTSGFHRGVDKVRSDIGRLDGPLGRMHRGFARAGGAMGSIVGRSKMMLRSLAAVAVKLAIVGAIAGGVLAGGLGFAMNQAVQFERSMLNVQSIAKVSPAAFAEMKKQVLDLTRTLPQSADELAHGLYDIQSSGFAGAQGVTILAAAAKAASAGLASTADSAKGIVAVLNAYGMGAKDAAYVSDVLFQVVNRGVITFPELAREIGKTTAVAAALHVPLAQVAAGIALLTRHGIDGANATTQLNAIMNSMLKPSSAATKEAKKLGINWSSAGLKARGLSGMMADLIKKTGGSAAKMAILLGDARAIRGAFVLASGGGKEFKDELGFFNNVAGVTDDVLSVQKQGLGYQLDVLKNNLIAVAIGIGTQLIPKVLPLVQGLSAWVVSNQVLIDQITTGLVNGIVMVAGFIGTLVKGVSDWVTANRPLIDQVTHFASNVLTTLWTVVTTQIMPALFGSGGKGGLVGGLVDLGSQIFNFVIPKVQAFIDTLTKPGGVIDSVLKVAGPVVDALLGGFGAIIGALFGTKGGGGGRNGRGGPAGSKGLIPALGDLAGVLWDDGKSPLAQALKAIASVFGFIARVIGIVIGKLSELVDFIAKHTREIGLLGSLLNAMGHGGAWSPGDLQNVMDYLTKNGKAAGGFIPANRPVLVGERGPEIVVPEGNANVLTNEQSQGALAGGPTYQVTINNPEPRAATGDVARVLRRIGSMGISGAPRLAGSGL